MITIGEKIINERKKKGLTQEDLAELSKINLRTIQRIENSQNIPRGKTLNLIGDALQLDIEDLTAISAKENKKSIGEIIANLVFLMVFNITLMSVFGYLTLDSYAIINSRIGALLLSFFVPFFIVLKTINMRNTERLLKFGTGFIVYFILILFSIGIPRGFVSTLIPCIFLNLAVLFYGKELFKLIFPNGILLLK